MVKVEKQVNRVEQNGPKNNLEFDGIPQSISQDKLRETVVKIVNDVSDEKIEMKDVEAVHRLHSKRNPKPVIVRMKRNVIDSVRENRRKLKDVGRRLNIQGDGIFINHNLSPNMKSIEHNARKLLKDGLIKGCWFSNASVRVQCLDGRSLSFDHELDLFEAFPGYEGYTFDTNFYDKVLNNDLLEQFTGFYGGYGINNDVIDPVESGDA